MTVQLALHSRLRSLLASARRRMIRNYDMIASGPARTSLAGQPLLLKKREGGWPARGRSWPARLSTRGASVRVQISIINHTLPSTIRAVIGTLTCTSNSTSDSECYQPNL